MKPDNAPFHAPEDSSDGYQGQRARLSTEMRRHVSGNTLKLAIGEWQSAGHRPCLVRPESVAHSRVGAKQYPPDANLPNPFRRQSRIGSRDVASAIVATSNLVRPHRHRP
jgi:hypothetical protein